MTFAITAVLGIIFLAVFLTIEQKHAGLFAATLVLLSTSAVPRVLIIVEPNHHPFRGLANSDLVVTTYSAAIFVVAVGLTLRGEGATLPRPWILLLALLPTMGALEWGLRTNVLSGIAHLLIAFLAWPIGTFVARCLAGSEKLRSRFFALLIMILGMQIVIGLLQLNHMIPSIISSDIEALDPGDSRVTGTLGAAPNLSKIAFLFLLLGLQATGAKSKSNRLAGYVLVSGAIALTALTVSRANLLACAVTLALWLILAPKRFTLGRRILAGVTAGTVLILMAGPTIQRFLQDPEGATRPELLAGALDSVDQFWFLGAGINSYVETLSETVPIVAVTGQPVHNAALYILIELGAFLSLLFFWPLVSMVRLAARSFRTSLEARIVLSALPGLGVIAWTGWGLLSTFILPTLIFVAALLRQSIVEPIPDTEDNP